MTSLLGASARLCSTANWNVGCETLLGDRRRGICKFQNIAHLWPSRNVRFRRVLHIACIGSAEPRDGPKETLINACLAVQGDLILAVHDLPALVFPFPDEEQMAALNEAAAYLALVGRQVSCMLLGRPPLGEGVVTIAEFSDALWRSAMLCDGLRELAESQGRH